MSDSISKALTKRTFGGILGSAASKIGDMFGQMLTGGDSSKSSKKSNEMIMDFKLKEDGIVNRLMQMDKATMTIDKSSGETKVNIPDPVLRFILTGDKSGLKKTENTEEDSSNE